MAFKCTTGRIGDIARRSLILLSAAAAALLSGTAARAESKVYALFVGLDHYAYESPAHADAVVPALDGAVADVAYIQKTILDHYPLTPDRTVVLTNALATRAAIIAALNRLIEEAATDQGSTVLFYYAGHGALLRDLTGTQATGNNSTLVVHDARRPGEPDADLRDVELDQIISVANRWGVSVVTIFDSCHSATATRGFSPRRPRGIRTSGFNPANRQLPFPLPVLPAGQEPRDRQLGLRVHFAAAQDSETAGEEVFANGSHGDFTEALVETLNDPRVGPTYSDIAESVRARLYSYGSSQTPHLEGTTLHTGFLGNERSDPRLYKASRTSGERFEVPGGRVVGLSKGSEFEAFDSVSSVRNKKVLGSARVIESDLVHAMVVVEPLPPYAKFSGGSLWLQEIRHVVEKPLLKVVVDVRDLAAKNRISDILRQTPGVELVVDHPQIVVLEASGGFRLLDADGAPRTKVLPLEVHGEGADRNGRNCSESLTTALECTVRWHEAIDLVSHAPKALADLVIESCSEDGSICEPATASEGDSVLHPGQRFRLTLANTSERPQYLYFIDLGPDHAIDVLYPTSEAQLDGAVETNDRFAPKRVIYLGAQAPMHATWNRYSEDSEDECHARANSERDILLVIASERRLSLKEWEQGRNSWRKPVVSSKTRRVAQWRIIARAS